ncbi:unnamed protein product [Schistosoma mattheei]|uniref:Uncharacterized protein n=1 Tax=Schistosoma mattheei TaxID=31246 RepID=A0A183PBN9_9TREM|nr:unnamed protein product [Schistosoma mattheei]
MAVGGSQQETLNPGFIGHDTRQQRVIVILRELMLPDMMVGGSRQEILDLRFVLLGTRQQGVPVILKELVLPGGFDPVSPSFAVRDVTTEISGTRL